MLKFLILLSMVVTPELFAASPKEFSTALNIAGRQRMLTQKMSKEALFAHLNVNKAANAAAAKKTMGLFESSLNSLMNGDAGKGLPKPPNDKIAAQLKKVKTLWTNLKSAISSGDVGQIANTNLPVLKEMNNGVGMYERASIKAGIKGKGKVINVAGRQRMLSQKMAKEALLIASKNDVAKNVRALQSTQKLFEASMDALVNGSSAMRIEKTKDAGIQKQLGVVTGLYAKYKVAIDKVIATKAADAATLATIEKLSPQVLKEMNKAVGMYAAK